MKPLFLGKAISEISFAADNLGLAFDDHSGVTFYNDHSLSRKLHPYHFVGRKVVAEVWSPPACFWN